MMIYADIYGPPYVPYYIIIINNAYARERPPELKMHNKSTAHTYRYMHVPDSCIPRSTVSVIPSFYPLIYLVYLS